MIRNLSDSIKYSSILGTTNEEVNLNVKQFEAYKSGDPRNIRAVEIEKYGKVSGLSQDLIDKGVKSVLNGDIETEKQITTLIISNLEKNPDFEVKQSNINNLFEEQLAVERASYLILSSGVNFGKGSNQIEIEKLAEEVQKILEGKIDETKVAKIENKYSFEMYRERIINNIKVFFN